MKNPSLLRLAATITALFVSGCSNPASSPVTQGSGPGFDLAAARMVIEANNRRFTTAHVTGDNATIDNMFTLDARALPPGADPVIGRAAIARLTVEYLGYGISEFREDTTDFYGNEDILIDQGNYVIVYGKDKTVEAGKYVNVWKKEDGTWKIYSNIWNTNAPASPAK